MEAEAAEEDFLAGALDTHLGILLMSMIATGPQDQSLVVVAADHHSSIPVLGQHCRG